MGSKIQLFFHRLYLKRKLSQLQVERVVANFDTAKTVGIIYNAANPTEEQFVRQFSDDLQQRQKAVEILGYYKKPPKEHQPTHPQFTRKDLNWLLLPKAKHVHRYVNQEFDILVNFHLGNSPELEFIPALSKAKFRVGRYHDNKTNCYEFMINLAEGEGLKEYLIHVENYLKMIKSDDA